MAQHAPRFLQIVEAVRVNIRECTVSDVRERQARCEQFLLFDVRADPGRPHERHCAVHALPGRR